MKTLGRLPVWGSAVLACILVLHGAASRAAAQQADRWENGARKPDRVETYRKVGDFELTIDVYLPAGHKETDRRPAIVFFFGGGWSGGSTRQFAHHSAYLTSRGMVVFAADYRINTRNKSTIADAVVDAKQAIRWVRTNAASLGVDPDRIASGGGSAGGHLAAAVAMLPGFDDATEADAVSNRSNAMALFNPALSLLAEDFAVDRAKPRATSFADRMGAEPAALSPLSHVRGRLPPAIVFHGEKDTTVPFAQARKFVEKMKEADNRAELAAYPEAVHGFFNYGRGDNSDFVDTLRKLDGFLVSLGYLDGQESVDAYVKAIPSKSGK